MSKQIMRGLIVILIVILPISLAVGILIVINNTSWEKFEACHIERSGSLDYCFARFVINNGGALIEYKECISQTDDLEWCFKWIELK